MTFVPESRISPICLDRRGDLPRGNIHDQLSGLGEIPRVFRMASH